MVGCRFIVDRLDKRGILCCDLTVNRVIDKTLTVENSNQFHGNDITTDLQGRISGMCAFHSIPPVHYVFDSTSIAVTCGKQVTATIWNQMVYPIRHYSPDIRANHRPGCWKQLPLPVPHCWQYRRRLESIATVRIMIADPSLEVCVPRHLSRLWGRSTAVTAVSSRQNRDAPAETLLGLRQGQLYVAGDSDIRLPRCRKGGKRAFLFLYI